jgi:tRNA A22 N-methylase
MKAVGTPARREKRLPQLDGRQARIADLLPVFFDRLVDVGTDHAHLALHLVRAGRTPCALAVDIRPGPLAVAERNIRNFGLQSRIIPLLSDGLQQVRLIPGDHVVIAGLGGLEILSILREAQQQENLPPGIVLILQAMKSLPELRRGLAESGFTFLDEQLARAGRYDYPLIKVASPAERVPAGGSLSDLQAHVGLLLADRRRHDATTSRLWPNYLRRLQRRTAQIAAAAQDDRMKKLSVLLQEMESIS